MFKFTHSMILDMSLSDNIKNNKMPGKQRIRIVRSWRNNSNAPTVVFSIPHDLAQIYEIDKPCNLFLIPCRDGILLRKVNLRVIKNE